MKFYNITSKFLICILFTLGLLSIYDGYLLFNWVATKFLDKFEVSVVLSTKENIEDFMKEIKNFESKNLKFKEINFITKEDLFNEVKQNPEFSGVLSVIEENPFFDFVKIKFIKYYDPEFTNFLSILKSKSLVKEVIFDYNIKSYLSRLSKITKFLNFGIYSFYILLVFVVILQIIDFFQNVKNLYLRTIFFTPIYIFFVLVNKKILDFIISQKTNITYYDVIFYILVYIINALLINKKD